MKWKSILPLLIVLAVLAALAWMKNAKEKPPSIEEQAKLAALMPDDLTPGDVAKIEMFAGGAPDQKVVLAWNADASKWVATSSYDAPVLKDKMDKFLEKLTKLKGEYRAKATTDESLGTYKLAEAEAFHVVGYAKDSETPSFNLLVGKSPKYGTAFVRPAGAQEVYVADVDLRSEAGVMGEDLAKAPEVDTWLDKNVLDVEKDKITKLALNTPEKSLAFEKREKPKPEEPKTDAAEGEGEGEAKPETPKEFEWVLASGGLGGPHKQAGVDNLLTKIDNLTATTVADPSKLADWRLDPPQFRLTMSVEGQPQDVVIEGGRPDPNGDGYVRVAGAEKPMVYKLSKYNFDGLFPKGSDLFDLPALSIDTTKATKIEITQPQGNIVLAKQDNAWSVTQPKADLKLASGSADAIARALNTAKAADYTESGAATGIDAATRTVTVSGGDATHKLTLGADAQGIAGAYAKLDDGKVLVLDKATLDKICVEPKNLYQRTLLDVPETEITAITVEKGEPYTLTRMGEEWLLTLGGQQVPADQAAVSSLVSAITGAQADSIRFGQSALEGQPESKIVVKAAGGDTTIAVGPEAEGKHPVSVSGKNVVFEVGLTEITQMFPAPDTLKKPETEPAPAPETVAPADAAAPTAGPVQTIQLPPVSADPAAENLGAPKAPAGASTTVEIN